MKLQVVRSEIDLFQKDGECVVIGSSAASDKVVVAQVVQSAEADGCSSQLDLVGGDDEESVVLPERKKKSGNEIGGKLVKKRRNKE